MPRKRATVEYLERLVVWAGGRTPFCERTGINPQNLSSYLAGTKPISWDRLRHATRSIFGEPPAFVPVLELHNLSIDGLPAKSKLGTASGVYALFDSAMRLLYFGKATSLYAEVRQTLEREVDHVRTLVAGKRLKFRDVSTYLSAYAVCRSDSDFRHDLEALALRVVRNTTFNKNFGKFKRNA